MGVERQADSCVTHSSLRKEILPKKKKQQHHDAGTGFGAVGPFSLETFNLHNPGRECGKMKMFPILF